MQREIWGLEALREYRIELECPCGHEALVDPEPTRLERGNMLLEEYLRLLRCSSCGRRATDARAILRWKKGNTCCRPLDPSG